MEIRANELYRAILSQAKREIAEAQPHVRARAVADLADFVLSDVTTESTEVLKEVLESHPTEPWDTSWVVPEIARATLDAFDALATVVGPVLVQLSESDDTQTNRELRHRLASVIAVVGPPKAQPPKSLPLVEVEA